jgi:hypothetical protein
MHCAGLLTFAAADVAVLLLAGPRPPRCLCPRDGARRNGLRVRRYVSPAAAAALMGVRGHRTGLEDEVVQGQDRRKGELRHLCREDAAHHQNKMACPPQKWLAISRFEPLADLAAQC